jgi:very-short-patch-repair endonuclease/transposase-like protein
MNIYRFKEMYLIIKMERKLENVISSEIVEDYEIIIEESDEEEQVLTVYNGGYENKEYFIGSEVCELLGYTNTFRAIQNISDDNKISFKNYTGKKEPKIDSRQILINKEGIYELLNKNKKVLSEHTINVLNKASIDISKFIVKVEVEVEVEVESEEKGELTMYSYINNGYCFEYFVGFEITSKLGYKNTIQTLVNVSKQNKLEFKDYPGVKKPKLDPKTILITRDGAIEILIKTRKRISPDVLHILKEFGITTTNRKCLTKEQQTLSTITDVFKTEKFEDQYKVGNYYIDLYFTEHKIAVECDELGHSDRKPHKERERMDYINEQLDINDCHWIRFNPDEYNFDISKVIGQIYRKIDEIKEIKLKEEYLKLLEEEKKKKLVEEKKYKFSNNELKFTKEDIEFEVHSGKMKAPPRDFLVQELKKGNSMLKIGQHLGISSKPVVKWLKEYSLNIDDYKNNYDAPPKDELIELFKTKNQTEVAEHYYKSAHIIRKWLKLYDLNLDELKSEKVEINKEMLLKLINEMVDEKEISKRLNVTELQLSKYIKMHNITRIPSKTELEKNLHLKSKDDLATLYNTTRNTLRKWIKSYGLEDIRFTSVTHKRIKAIKDNIETTYDSIKDLCKEIGKNKVNEYVDTNDEYNGYKFEFI